MKFRIVWLIDEAWLIGLMLYVLAGMPIATFHGDESMQIYASGDYWVAVADGNPAQLTTLPPYPIDSDPHLRILNGSFNRYAIGAMWNAAGYTRDQLPPRPGWDWALSYADNAATNHRPAEALLQAARLPSALLFALSVPVMFAVARLQGGRLPAYVVSGLYALHPALLLNGRRAMQEGAMLFFGMFTILIAAWIAHRRIESKSVGFGLWAALTLFAGLALASKHSAAVFVIGAFVWILAAELTRFKVLRWLSMAIRVTVSGVVAAALFIALSPALWNDPAARVRDLLTVRAELLDIQVQLDPVAPMSFDQRVQHIIAQAFLTAPMHFEVEFWRDDPTISAEVSNYAASSLSGLTFGMIGGAALTILAVAGGIGALWRVFRREVSSTMKAFSAGVLAWTLVNIIVMLANPLPWQRYYLPWIPVACLLVGVAIVTVRDIYQKLRTTNAPLAQ